MGDSTHTVLLLQQISQQLAGISKSSTNTALPSYPLCQPTPSTVLSLCFGLACAITATFVQQWARNCLQAIERRPAPHKKARTRALLCEGMKSFGMTTVVDGIPTLLHIAVFLFCFFCRPCWPSFREQPPHHLQHIGYCLSLCYVISYCYISTSHPPLLSLQNPTVRCLLVDTTVLRPTPIHRWERQSEEYKWW